MYKDVSIADISVHLIIRFVWVTVVSKFIYDTVFRKLTVNESENLDFQAASKYVDDKEIELENAMESLKPASDTRIENMMKELEITERELKEETAAADDGDARTIVKDKYGIIINEIKANIAAAKDSTNLYPVDDIKIQALKEELVRLNKIKITQFNKFAVFDYRQWVKELFSTTLTLQNKISLIMALSVWIATLLGQAVFALCLSKDGVPLTISVSLTLLIWWVITPVIDLLYGYTTTLFDTNSKKSVLFDLIAKYHPNTPLSTGEVVVKLNQNLSSGLVSQAYALSFFVILFVVHFVRSLFSPGYRIWKRLGDNYSWIVILFLSVPVMTAWYSSSAKFAEAKLSGVKDNDAKQRSAEQAYNIGFLRGIILILVTQALFLRSTLKTNEITRQSTMPTYMQKHNTNQKKAVVL